MASSRLCASARSGFVREHRVECCQRENSEDLSGRPRDVHRAREIVSHCRGGNERGDARRVHERDCVHVEHDRHTELTDILALLAEGRCNRSIADRLMYSIKSIESSIATVFAKLGMEPVPDDNRRVLAVLAYLDPGR